MNRRLMRWVLALASLHLLILCAGFFAPNDPEEQDRERPYAAPAKIHFVDSHGHSRLRPFVYPLRLQAGSFDQFEEDRSTAVPLRFLVAGPRYRLLGFIPCRLRLFGSDGTRLYILGSDAYGRDLFSRILYGGQISLLAGLLGAAITLFVGATIGALAGYYGGWRDAALMRVAELFVALPWLYLLLALRAFLPLSVSPLEAFFLVVIVIGAVGWARPARMVRGVVLSAKERDFVRVARGFGATDRYLLFRHILPQTSSVLLTQAALLVPQFVLAEMTLSFLGLGVPEPVPSWGNLLAGLQQYSVLISFWWMYLPALAVVPFFLGYLGLASALQQSGGAARIEDRGVA